MEYPIEKGQRMLVRPNNFESFKSYAHQVVVLFEVKSTENGIIAHCSYYDDSTGEQRLDIPLFLLWRIADDEDLLALHEAFIQSRKLPYKEL